MSGEYECQTDWEGFKQLSIDRDIQEGIAIMAWQQLNPPGSDILRKNADAVQHLGGKTNWIDFTDNLLVALFFACFEEGREGCSEEDGRLLFVHTDNLGFSNVKRPSAEHVDPIQQSVLVKPEHGGILNLGDKLFCAMIPKELKDALLDDLDLLFGINFETIFSGLVPYTHRQEVFLEKALLAAEKTFKKKK